MQTVHIKQDKHKNEVEWELYSSFQTLFLVAEKYLYILLLQSGSQGGWDQKSVEHTHIKSVMV